MNQGGWIPHSRGMDKAGKEPIALPPTHHDPGMEIQTPTSKIVHPFYAFHNGLYLSQISYIVVYGKRQYPQCIVLPLSQFIRRLRIPRSQI
jgi:hypothetical protein